MGSKLNIFVILPNKSLSNVLTLLMPLKYDFVIQYSNLLLIP